MFKIVHLVTGVAALLLSLIPSLRTEAIPFLQQPEAVYLALLGLLNLLLAPVVPLYYRGARLQLQYLASALLVLAVVLQTVTVLVRPELGNLPALLCAALAVLAHLVAGFSRSSGRSRNTGGAAQESSKRDTGTVKWFNTSKASALSRATPATISSYTFAPSVATATACWSKANAWSSRSCTATRACRPKT